MSTFWDLMGSMLIGSLLMITILAFSNNLSNERCMSNLWVITQESACTLSDVIEYDLSKIGYGTGSKENNILYADSNAVSFLLDLDNDGSLDSVMYYVSDVSGASGTENPNDVLFYRIVNDDQNAGSALGVTNFRINYYDSTGAVTDTLNRIKEIEVIFDIESPLTIDDYYPTVHIRKSVKPKNIL